MKTKLAVLSAALLFSVAAAAGDRKSSPPGHAKGASTTVTTTRAVDADYRHGRTVRETAHRDDLAKPRGESVREVAQTQRDFRRLDTDRDGVIETVELTTGSDLALRFATFDTNADGRLSRGEYDAYIVAGLDDD
ncbi:MAG TPA: hypothetical protein VFO79_13065 [Xanthomonadales bacterium]|nr:hypothetical protein [Xanthomonadales bacterium]